MLYQLSYLGTSLPPGRGAAVYSQAGRPCPPRFALRFRMAQPAIGRTWHSSKGGGDSSFQPANNVLKQNKYFLLAVFVLVLASGDCVGTGEPAVQIDITTAIRAERPRCLGRRLAADRARFGAAGLVGRRIGWRLSWHSASQSGPETLRRRAGSSFHTAEDRRHWNRNRPS